MKVDLYKGDCLKLLPKLKSNSIDLALVDLPYQETINEWDSIIPMKPLFKQYLRLIKDHGALLLFGQGMFGAKLMINAPKKMPYRYEWIWEKTMPVGFLLSHHMPLRAHENIYVFYKHLPTYNIIKREGFQPYYRGKGNKWNNIYHKASGNYTPAESKHGERFPIDVIKFSNGHGGGENHQYHPTQKPVKLLEYLIKTYTNKGMTVLDNTMGSGSTGVAAVNLDRNFIGMEKEPKYYEIAKKRIHDAKYNHQLSLF